MNGACITQMLKVTELLKNTCYTKQELLDSLRLFFCYINHHWDTKLGCPDLSWVSF